METTIKVYEIIVILLIHWIADFVCQSNWQAQNKSSNNKALLSHITTYTIVWFISLPFLLAFNDNLNIINTFLNTVYFST